MSAFSMTLMFLRALFKERVELAAENLALNSVEVHRPVKPVAVSDMAVVPEEPCGGHRSHRLLHRSHRDLPGAVLLHCPGALAPPHPSLQCNGEPDG